MAWTKESGRVPTDVGRILIELFDQPFIDERHEATVNSLDTWEPLPNRPNSGSVSVYDRNATLLVEDTDFSIDYTNGAIMALTGGSVVVPAKLEVRYTFRGKNIFYNLEILDQFGDALKKFDREDLEPHLTASEKSQLSSFVDTLRARAESQLL